MMRNSPSLRSPKRFWRSVRTRSAAAPGTVGVLAAGYAPPQPSPLLSNTFTVPGTDSERVRTILQKRFGDRSDGEFLIIYRLRDRSVGAEPQLGRAAREAAKAVPTGKATALRPAPGGVFYGSVLTTLDLADAKGYTDDIRKRLHPPPGVDAYVSGQPAIERDLDPILSRDLRRGESIAVPIALLVLLAVFGLSFAATIPFLFAAATILATLGIVFLIAHELTMATYVTNLVYLIGLGIAIDYSLLVVYRFREELGRTGSKDDAIVRTMATAGRAVIVSGATVAIGLGLLLCLPVPFMRSVGVGGFLIPLLSIAAAATLQPALLSLYGRRGVARAHVADRLRRKGLPLPRFAGRDVEHGFWARLARWIMARPLAFLAGGVAVLVAAAVPVFALELTPGSAQGIPQYPQSVRGLNVLRAAVGPGALSPSTVLIDAGEGASVRSPEIQAAIGRLTRGLEADREVAYVQGGASSRYVDPSGRYEQLIVAGRHEYGGSALAEVRRPTARVDHPGGGLPATDARARRRRTRSGRRLPPPVLPVLSLARPRSPGAHLPRPDARLPLGRAAAQGRAPELAVRRGGVRPARRRLQVASWRRGRRPLPVRTGRGVDPDLPVRDAVRSLDGL